VTPSERNLTWVTVTIAGLVLLAHFVLISGGGWGGDEFQNFADWRLNGPRAFVHRLLTWSPRPSSELTLYAYFWGTEYLKAALITPFLTFLWVLLIGGAVCAVWQRSQPGLLPRLALALATLAMFLLGRPIATLFYWPMGAAAYLLALMGIVVVTFQTLGGRTTSPLGQTACCLGLSLTVTSSEVGLFFVISFTGTLLVLDLAGLIAGRRADFRRALWYLIPLAQTAVMVVWVACMVIANPRRGMGTGSVYFHHFWPSLMATAQGLVSELTLGDGSPSGLGGLTSVTTAVLLLIGFIWGCRAGFRRTVPWRPVAALGVGLSGCYGLSILASYYEYSTQMHEPHNAFRHCVIILLILAIARVVSLMRAAEKRFAPEIGPLALMSAIAIAFAPRVPALIGDYGLLPYIREARAQTWQMGFDPSTKRLRYVVSPQGQVLTGMIPWPAGHFVLGGPDTEWWMTGIMLYFSKSTLELVTSPARGSR
jgi:hypothetical protein